jgi:signal transduction histidine kinase
MFKNIKTKLLFWYFVTIVIVMATFSHIVLNEFTKLILEKQGHIHTSIKHLENILIVWVPILLIISIIIGYFIIKNTLIPVKKIIDEVKDIEANQLEKRLTSHTSNDEIEELVITFNFMLDKLDDSFSKIKRFSNDVSHELKTPLTVVRGEIELGLRKDRTNNEYKNILNSILEETKVLQDLIDNLLFLSKSNDNEIKSKFEDIELDEIITNVISANKQLIKQKQIKIEIKKLESVSCNGHPLLLKILVGNILQNAIKYSHKNSIVEIYLDKNILIIKDYGIGIKNNDLENIFDRFYRVDKSRARGGYGLGLSIAKSIAILHNFQITVDSQYDEYTQFNIKL